MTVVFIELPNTKIELLEPLGEGSPIAKFLEKNADGGIHHVCYEVDDILAARDRLKATGPACWAMARRRSARMASRCCSCTPKISTARWWNWSRPDGSGRVASRPACGPSASSEGGCPIRLYVCGEKYAILLRRLEAAARGFSEVGPAR